MQSCILNSLSKVSLRKILRVIDDKYVWIILEEFEKCLDFGNL